MRRCHRNGASVPLLENNTDFDPTISRSRALEFPGVGHAMVPCIDMANHASGEATAALYEADKDGNGLLLLRDGRNIASGGEVTIT